MIFYSTATSGQSAQTLSTSSPAGAEGFSATTTTPGATDSARKTVDEFLADLANARRALEGIKAEYDNGLFEQYQAALARHRSFLRLSGLERFDIYLFYLTL